MTHPHFVGPDLGPRKIGPRGGADPGDFSWGLEKMGIWAVERQTCFKAFKCRKKREFAFINKQQSKSAALVRCIWQLIIIDFRIR